MSRIVVIGAGLGGLAAAARLARAGHRVTVLEASERIGGKMGTVDRATASGTFRFDTGPSLITLPQVFEELFTATGDPLEDVIRLRPLEPMIDYRFADGTSVASTRDLDLQATLMDAAFGPGAGPAWLSVIARGARIWAASEGPVLRSPLTAASAARRLHRVRDLAATRPWQSLRQVGMRQLSDPRQRRILDRYATYAGSDPRRAPAALAVIPFVEQAFGAWYVEGGLHRLAEAVRDRALLCGAVLRAGVRVTSIELAAGRVCGVTVADGPTVACDVVVADADASAVYGSLLPPRARRVPPADSSAGFVVLAGLSGRTPGLAHHTVLFGGQDYDAEFDALFAGPGRVVDDPAIYVCAPVDGLVCPPGHEALFVLVNAPAHGAGGVDWDGAGVAEGYADHILALLATRGLPIGDRLLFREVLTPADLQRSALAPGGAIYGSASHGALTAFRRPRNCSRVRGLYLVGGSAHPGGGLPLVTLSAAIVAQLIGPASG